MEGLIAFAKTILPLFDLNLGWIVPALIGLALGLVIRWLRTMKRNRKAKKR